VAPPRWFTPKKIKIGGLSRVIAIEKVGNMLEKPVYGILLCSNIIIDKVTMYACG